jgi:hypothetical protein
MEDGRPYRTSRFVNSLWDPDRTWRAPAGSGPEPIRPGHDDQPTTTRVRKHESRGRLHEALLDVARMNGRGRCLFETRPAARLAETSRPCVARSELATKRHGTLTE